MNEPKLYFRFSDGDESFTMMLSGCMQYIDSDIKSVEASTITYTLEPVWLTDEEFDALPEH